jgi:hypothetical protein
MGGGEGRGFVYIVGLIIGLAFECTKSLDLQAKAVLNKYVLIIQRYSLRNFKESISSVSMTSLEKLSLGNPRRL